MPDRPPAEPSESEASLVLACAEGDAAAWERFVARYGRLVSVLARRMWVRRAGHATDADIEEVVANLFLALLKGERRLLRRYRPEFRLSTYLGVICRTEVGKLLRQRRSGKAFSLDDADGADSGARQADSGSPSPLDDLERRERDAAISSLRLALDAMPPRDRLLLTLKFIEGLDYGQIADVLRVRRDSVGQLLHRAKERLAARVPELAHWVGGVGGGDRGSGP